MVNICTTQIDSPKAWRGADLKDDPSWVVELDDGDITELEHALSVAKKANRPFPELTREDFPLDTLAPKLDSLLTELYDGRGFAVLRGMPVKKYDYEDIKLMYWGMCRYIGGQPLVQGRRGEYLTNVRDRGEEYGKINVRGNGTNALLPFHTDSTDIIGLLCMRKAMEGGLSSIVSSTTVHNEILANHPEYLGLLYSGYYYIIRDNALSENGVTDRKIPVFSYEDGFLSGRYLRNQINAGAVKREIPFTDLEEEALDYFDELTQRPDLHLAMSLQEGDIQFANNYTILHSRSGFVDGPDADRKRHMARLWFKFPEPLQWAISDEFMAYNGVTPDPNQPQRLES